MFMFNVSCTSGQFSTQRLFLTLSVKSRCLELLHLHWILSSMSERRSFNILISRKCKKLLRENFGKWPVWWVKIICAAKKTRCTLCRHETESWHETVFSECSASDTSGPSNGTWHWHCQSRGLIHYAWPSKCWQKMLFDSLLTHCCEAWKLWVFHLKTEKKPMILHKNAL